MTLTLRYPVYLVASADGVVVVRSEGSDCIMLFHSRKPAERETERIQASHPLLGPLTVLPVPSRETLRDGLRGLPFDIKCVVWDPTGAPATRVSLDDLLRSL